MRSAGMAAALSLMLMAGALSTAKAAEVPPASPPCAEEGSKYPCIGPALEPDVLEGMRFRPGYFSGLTTDQILKMAEPWVPQGYVPEYVEVDSGTSALIHLQGDATRRICNEAGAADDALVLLTFEKDKLDGHFEVRGCDQGQ